MSILNYLFSPNFLLVSAIELLIRLTILLSVVGLLCIILQHVTAVARRLIWLSAIVLTLGLPILTWILPSIDLEFLSQSSNRLESPATSSSMQPQPSSSVVVSDSLIEDSTTGLGFDFLMRLNIFGLLMLLIWLIGSVYFLNKVFRNIFNARRLIENAVPATDDQTRSFDSIVNQWGRTVRLPPLYYSEEIATPIVLGIKRPVIVLPAESTAWDMEKRESALLHEFAHVLSADNLTRILASLACAIYWFHPLIWYSSRQLKEEQEKSADNFVLNNGVCASLYVQNLLDIVKSIQEKDQHSELVTTMGSYSFFPQRMRALLNSDQARHRISFTKSLLLCCLMLVVSLPIASITTVPSTADTTPNAALSLVDTTLKDEENNPNEASTASFIGNSADALAENFRDMAGPEGEISRLLVRHNIVINSGLNITSEPIFTEDATLETSEGIFLGREQIYESYGEMFLAGVQIVEDNWNISVDGDLATVTGQSEIGISDSEAFASVNYIIRLEKISDVWLITQEKDGFPNFSFSKLINVLF